MKLYIPSWNGDFRLHSLGDDASELILHQPTAHERMLVGSFLHEAFTKKWIKTDPGKGKPYTGGDHVALEASLKDASKLLIKITRPRDRTLTAVSFAGVKLAITEGASSMALEKIAADVGAAEATKTTGEPAAAVSVKRPTPSCPSCLPGAIAPASEALLAFLSPQEHEDWAAQRAIVVEGGMSGHRYLLAHRHSRLAQKIGRICYDLDDRFVVHFHDSSVPPEEEVLAAKLCLEHREPWLRNEASCFAAPPDARDIFKNPFGGMGDGTESAAFANKFGEIMLTWLSEEEKQKALEPFTARAS